MPRFRIVLIILTALWAIPVSISAVSHLFMGGGPWYPTGHLLTWLVTVVIHPLGLVALVMLVTSSRPSGSRLRRAYQLLLLNLAGDWEIPIFVTFGAFRMEKWWTALLFSIVPFIGVIYCKKIAPRNVRADVPGPTEGALEG